VSDPTPRNSLVCLDLDVSGDELPGPNITLDWRRAESASLEAADPLLMSLDD